MSQRSTDREVLCEFVGYTTAQIEIMEELIGRIPFRLCAEFEKSLQGLRDACDRARRRELTNHLTILPILPKEPAPY